MSVHRKRRMKKRKNGKIRTEKGGGSSTNFQSDVFPVPPCTEHFNHLLLFGNSKTILGLLNSGRKKKDILHRCQFQEFCRDQKGHFLKMLRLQETNQASKVHCTRGAQKVNP